MQVHSLLSRAEEFLLLLTVRLVTTLPVSSIEVQWTLHGRNYNETLEALASSLLSNLHCQQAVIAREEL